MGPKFRAGLVAPGGLQLLHRKALPEKALVDARPVGILVGLVGEGEVPLPQVQGAPGADHLRGQPGVVGVDVGEKDIQGVLLRPGGPQALLEGLAALRQAEASVDEQAALPPPDQVGVELPQRVPGQGNGQPEDPRQDLHHPIGGVDVIEGLDGGVHACSFRASPTRALAPSRSAPSSR